MHSRYERDNQESHLFVTPFLQITDSKVSQASEIQKGLFLKAVWMQQWSWALLRPQGALSCTGAASPSVTHRIAATLLWLLEKQTSVSSAIHPSIPFSLALNSFSIKTRGDKAREVGEMEMSDNVIQTHRTKQLQR